MTSDRQLKRMVDEHARAMIGEAFKATRAAEGLLPEELAHRVGLPVETITGIERGDELPDPIATRKLYGALPTFIDQLARLSLRRWQ